MAEAEALTKSKVVTWIKGGFTAVFGVVWGAVLMYLSPLVSSVIKPAKPVANFGVEQGSGLLATFQNRAVGATDGWWDFGDGSALEPFSPHQATLPHTYAKPGAYAAKLTVHNLIGDESERSVNVQFDTPGGGAGGSTPVSTATEVAALDVVSMRPDNYAPASFRVTGKVNNADLAVWALGDRPLQLIADPPASQERYVTLREPGKHAIRLAAVRGKQVSEKTVFVQVEPAPAGAAPALAVVNASYEAVQVESRTVPRNVAIELPQDFKGGTVPFQKEVLPMTGFQITKAELAEPVQHPSVKDVKLALTPDGKVVLSCELVKVSQSAAHSAHRAVAGLVLTEQRRGAVTQQVMEPIVAMLSLPGSTMVQVPPPPSGWDAKQHMLSFDLQEGPRTVKQRVAIPVSGEVMLQNRLWRLTATEVGSQVRIDAVLAPGVTPNTASVPSPVGVHPPAGN